eukprot:14782715-Alexandrium_andersonii.AAC.1
MSAGELGAGPPGATCRRPPSQTSPNLANTPTGSRGPVEARSSPATPATGIRGPGGEGPPHRPTGSR